ncbi:major facilitator family transporter (Permease) [Legionella busanensis]|uniref:Lysosomal dipeptide transporter MFSD1 n=1 Tax=Legionella busanensis TaxID=190655 RepID=A0A378JIX3_9GAMM|nr:MFS transporter [Legionella busanensis]STX51104.1 major facilitator family transporter (Permease) [Legionella busanensis]
MARSVLEINRPPKKSNVKKFAAYPILVITLAAGFLFYKYILQVFPSIITADLMQQFNLSGAGLGGLAATFYYTYMIMQLFVGILLDKYSTRWFTTLAVFSAAVGVLIFSQSQTILIASLARGLMGIGVAFATVAYMKLAATWFEPRHYAFISGLLATAAMAGAVFGQAPLAWLIANFGWRHCLLLVGIVGLFLACLFSFTVRDKQIHSIVRNNITFKDIKQTLRNKQNWLLTLYSGLAFSPIAVFGGLWGNPFLEQAYHLSKTQAASMISCVFIGLGLGSPLLGLLSDKLDNRREIMFFSTLLSCIAITIVLFSSSLSYGILTFLLFLFGFGLGAFMLVFAIAKEANPLALTATIAAMLNTSDAILDAITEPFIGKLLDLTWDGKIVNGLHVFSLSSYRIALTILPIYLIVGAILLIWLKEQPKS